MAAAVRASSFINGNLARVLLATYKLNGNKTLLSEGLRWCDTLVSIAIPAVTSRGEHANYWTTGYPVPGPDGDIYIADTGTAVTALAVCWHLATPERQTAYLTAMRKYTLFVEHGINAAPPGRGKLPSSGWILSGKNSTGALADGYYRGKLDECPYTIATGTTGAAFYGELYRINTTSSANLGVATAAAGWLANLVSTNGSMPYWLGCEVFPVDVHLYQAISYTAEGVYSVDSQIPSSSSLHSELATAFGRTVKFLIQQQNEDGTWGDFKSGDQQRSPRAISLMQWYSKAVTPLPGIQPAIQKWLDTTTTKFEQYGGKQLLIYSGFVGLVVADLIEFGVTFGGVP